MAESRVQTKEREEYKEALVQGSISLDNMVKIGELENQMEDLRSEMAANSNRSSPTREMK